MKRLNDILALLVSPILGLFVLVLLALIGLLIVYIANSIRVFPQELFLLV